jgi:lupus La protein
MTRTAYVKGFPTKDIEMSQLIDFFNPFEKVVHIYMRKYHDKATKTYCFKGSVFVSFAKREQCQEFLAKEKVEYSSVPLICKWQSEYLEDKKKERAEKSNKRGKKQEAPPKFEFPKGAVIHMEGLGSEVTRETLKDVFGKLEVTADIAFVDYSKGDKVGHVRFRENDDAKKVFAAFKDGKLSVNDSDVACRVLEGDEEKEFLEKAGKDMASRRGGNFGKGGKGRHGGGRDGDRHGHGGNRHGGDRRSNRKRRGEDDGGSGGEKPPAKKSATVDA